MDYGDDNEKGPGLETVRALHQTVVALRTALEESKSVISDLKSKAWPVESLQKALQALSLENHLLRRELLLHGDKEKTDLGSDTDFAACTETNHKDTELVKAKSTPRKEISQPRIGNPTSSPRPETKKVTIVSPKPSLKKRQQNLEARILVKTEVNYPKRTCRSLESLTKIKSPIDTSKKFSFSKTFSFSNLSGHNISREFTLNVDEQENMSKRDVTAEQPTENNIVEELVEEEPLSPQNDLEQTDEVDDIELIFTTDETKDSDFKGQLVSIDTGDLGQQTSNLLHLPITDMDQNLEVSDRELDDDVFNDNFDNENEDNSNFHSYDFKRENSQQCDSKSDTSINQEKSMKSYHSFQDSSFENRSLEKDESFDRFEERIRMVETDISKCGIQDVEYVVGRRNTCPNPIQYRPLLHREAISKGLTVGKKTRPILTHSNAMRKESGAQTDISALPRSTWRSESNLANKAKLGDHFTTLPSKYPLPGSRLRLSEKTVEARRVLLSDIGFTSMVPELSRSADHLFPANLKCTGTTPTYGQFLKTTDLYSPGYTSQKFIWTATGSPSECSQSHSRYSSLYPLSSPPAPSRRCSAPVSPSRKGLMKQTPSKVKFANGSLPELRRDWTTVDSGDSTDSLVEEAENYLRRSIDCIMTGRDMVATNYSEMKKHATRRSSAPEPAGDNVPPTGWQPFLPRVPRDLKLDHWVKVITPEGRVRGGRVRYIGPIASQVEQFVGVQLSNPDGYCDGSFNNRKYFQCEPYHGIFVPFKKVIMGWRP